MNKRDNPVFHITREQAGPILRSRFEPTDSEVPTVETAAAAPAFSALFSSDLRAVTARLLRLVQMLCTDDVPTNCGELLADLRGLCDAVTTEVDRLTACTQDDRE